MKSKKIFITHICILFILLLILSISIGTISDSDKAYNIESYQNVLIDKSKTIDIHDIVNQKSNLDFIAYDKSGVSSSIEDSRYWIHIPLDQLTYSNDKSLLEISKPHLSNLTFYQLSSNKEIIKKIQTGRDFPFSSRDIHYRHFLFELDPHHLDGDVYISVDTKSYLQVPSKLYSYSEFISYSSEKTLYMGLFYGALIIMIFYNAFLAHSLSDIRYVYYVLFVLSFVLLQSVWDGYSLMYLWPEAYAWDTISNPILISLCSLFFLLFNWEFFKIDLQGIIGLSIYKAFTLVLLVSIFLFPFMAMKTAVYIASLYALFSLLLSILSFIYIKKRTRAHYIYMTAWSTFFFMVLLSTLAGFGLIPYSFLTVHGTKLGVIVLVVLFSLALSDNFKEIENMRCIEAEKNILLKRLNDVNKKISSSRDIKLLYKNMLIGYNSFFSFDDMIVAIDTKDDSNTFSINTLSGISELKLCPESFKEYKNLKKFDISRPSPSILRALDLNEFQNSIIMPLESISTRKGFVLFTLKAGDGVSDKIKNLLIDYTHHISLTIDNITLIEELKVSSQLDGLTKIYNKKTFFEKGEDVIKGTSKKVTSIIMIDIDHFKKVNDTYGHIVGDRALVYISNQLLKYFSEDAIIARYGGEEFVIILQTKTKHVAHKMIEEFRKKIEETSIAYKDNHEVKITLSCGIAHKTDETYLDELVSKADILLYEAKRSGRNRVIAG